MNLEDSWPGLCTLFFLFLGLIIALVLRDSLFSYFSIFLAGSLSARFYYLKHSSRPMIKGFLLGYLVVGFWTNLILIFLAFLVGFFISYRLHSQNTFVTFKSKLFIK